MAEKETPTLCGLPTELQHLIVLNLHPSAAVALRQTNRWFHTHVSLHRLDKHDVSLFLCEREGKPKNCKPHPTKRFVDVMNYACYSCLCIKPAANFNIAHIDGEYMKGGRLWDQRFCFDCGLRQEKFDRGEMVRMAGGAKTRLFYVACSSVQTSFCRECRWCLACIASLRTWTGRDGAIRKTKNRFKDPCSSHSS